MMEDIAIRATGVSKIFKIYHDKPMTLKDRFLHNINKKYTDFPALKDINVTIKKGEQIGLIGHNGCGKSTLLKLFTRILYPEKGEIEVNGKVSSLLELGAGFHPDFSGRENIYTNATIFGLSKNEIDKIVDDIIDFSELSEFIDNPVRTYSSGMYMRLAFSVAVHVHPDILLVDEILAVGDASFQKKCLDRIMRFKSEGVTIVIVSHDLASIERVCNRVIWLSSGEIRMDGEPKSVINAYYEELFEKEKEKQPQKQEIKEENRYGTQAVEITDVVLLDKEGKESAVFDTEDKITVSLKVKYNESVDDFGFGIGIYSNDGSLVYGTNTYIEKVNIKGKPAVADFEIERLSLVDGGYYIDVACHTREGNPYDYRKRIKEFSVFSEIKDTGKARPCHKWHFNTEE